MIDKKMKRVDLIGRKCRPLYPMVNGAGIGITPQTICTIRNVVKGHGLTIESEPCLHCGQYAHIAGVGREELTLVEEEQNADTSHQKEVV